MLLHSQLYRRETSLCGSCPSKPGKGWICSTSWKISPGHWCSLVTYGPLKKWKTNPSFCTKNQEFAPLLGSILRNISNHGIDYHFDTLQPLLQDPFFLTFWDYRRADEGWGWSRWRLTGPQQLLLEQQLYRTVKEWNTTCRTMILKFHITIYKSYLKIMSCNSTQICFVIHMACF